MFTSGTQLNGLCTEPMQLPFCLIKTFKFRYNLFMRESELCRQAKKCIQPNCQIVRAMIYDNLLVIFLHVLFVS